MTGPEIVAVLDAKFGDKLKAKAGDAMDPCVTVEPSYLVAVCTFLRDDPRTRIRSATPALSCWRPFRGTPKHRPQPCR